MSLTDNKSVYDFGAIGDGVADDTAAFNAYANYVRANFTNTDYNYAGLQILIPPGKYCVSSWNLTGLLIQNLHVVGHGAVLIATAEGKHVIDCIGSRFIKFHGITVYSHKSVTAKSALQVGPAGSEACGNIALNDVSLIGHYAIAPYLNLGCETSTLDNVRLIQRNESTLAYAQVCDSLSTYLPTSDYAMITRSPGKAVSFTANNYHGCQIRNEGGGSASYLSATAGWLFDNNCYHLSFNDSAFVLYSTSTYRTSKLTIKGSFESSQIGLPVIGNSGLRHAVTFSGNGTNTAIDGFTFESSNMQAGVSVFRNSGLGSVRLSDADIRAHRIDKAGCVMFDATNNISIDGALMTQSSNKTNLGNLSSFNGVANVDSYTLLMSKPVLGSYQIFSRADSTIYQGGKLVIV